MPSDKKRLAGFYGSDKARLAGADFYGDSMLGQLALDKLHCSPQLAWAAVQVGSGGADAAMASQRFQNMNGSAFVGQVG